MANTLKDLAAQAKLVAQDALEKALTELKTYIDTQDQAGSGASADAIAAVNARINTLIGTDDATQAIDTFNEIKAFLADYSDSDTLKSLIDAAINAATTAAGTAESNAKTYADGKVQAEQTRATNAESGLSSRITTLENVSIMTAAEAETIFDSVFNPTPEP